MQPGDFPINVAVSIFEFLIAMQMCIYVYKVV